jgi:hypothetical protein
MQRRRFQNTLTFPDRLAKEAKRLREEAETKSPGPERDALLRKARQADTAAHIDQWISSPGLKPPTFDPDTAAHLVRVAADLKDQASELRAPLTVKPPDVQNDQ